LVVAVAVAAAAGTTFAEPEKKETYEFFPNDEVRKAMYRKALQGLMILCVIDPGEDKVCQTLREYYTGHDDIWKAKKAFAVKSEEFYKKYFSGIDKDAYIKLFIETAFDRATLNRIESNEFVRGFCELAEKECEKEKDETEAYNKN